MMTQNSTSKLTASFSSKLKTKAMDHPTKQQSIDEETNHSTLNETTDSTSMQLNDKVKERILVSAVSCFAIEQLMPRSNPSLILNNPDL